MHDTTTSKRTDGELLLLEIFKSRNCPSVGCMPKMCAISQLVSEPLNPVYQLYNILGEATHNVSTVT